MCLIVFIAFFCGLGVVCVYGYSNGNPYKLLSPLDADGKFCGTSDGYEKYPYLYFANIEESSWTPYSVCVSECPEANT